MMHDDSQIQKNVAKHTANLLVLVK